MKLKDFVAETLKEIVDGITDVQHHWSQKGGSIVPAQLAYYGAHSGQQFFDRESGRPIQVVEFDVAITTVEGTGTEGGVGVFVGPVVLGSKGKSNADITSANRIKFTVPVLFPPDKH